MTRLEVLGGVARHSELVRTAADGRALAAAIAVEAVRDLGVWLVTATADPALIVARRVHGTSLRSSRCSPGRCVAYQHRMRS